MKLTAAQIRRRAFAEHVASGKSGVESARLAGFKGNDHVLSVTAARLLGNPLDQVVGPFGNIILDDEMTCRHKGCMRRFALRPRSNYCPYHRQARFRKAKP